MADDGDALGDVELLLVIAGLGIAAWAIYDYVNAAAAAAPAGNGGVAPDPPPAAIFPPPAQPMTAASSSAAPAASAPGATAISPAGAGFTQRWESLSLTRYRDGAGYSIGWGHRIRPGENFNTIDRATADRLFLSDMSAVETAIASLVKVPLTQYEFDALADFVYNVGLTNFQRSTLLKTINQGDLVSAGREFLRWVFSNGNAVPGLERRRSAEQLLWNTGNYTGAMA